VKKKQWKSENLLGGNKKRKSGPKEGRRKNLTGKASSQ
jgi:hypothetical protein